LLERHDLGARLHARTLLRKHELAAGESSSGCDSRSVTCSGKTFLAIKILVQAL